MSWRFNIIAMALAYPAERMVQRLLASPLFHRGVRQVHRTVEDLKHGRDPLEPLRPGEATKEPGQKGFFSLFTEELRNQFRGAESKDIPPSPKLREKKK